MDRETKSVDDLGILRMLCDKQTTREQRLEILKSLQGHVFMDPEHQVVFESLCVLFQNGPFSAARLTVHLNNRGFPDVEVEKYISVVNGNRPRSENKNQT